MPKPPEFFTDPSEMRRIADEALDEQARKKRKAPPQPPASPTPKPSVSMEGLPERIVLLKPKTIETPSAEQLLQVSQTFFTQQNLPELARALPNPNRLTPEIMERLRNLQEQGLDQLFLFPPVELLTSSRDKIIQSCATNPLPGLSETNQYTAPYIDSTAKASTSLNRPLGKPYILAVPLTIPQETKGLKYPQIQTLFAKDNWNGLTLDDQLILQRFFAQRFKDHRFDAYSTDATKSQWSWLMDAEVLPSGRVDASWHPVSRRVDVYWYDSDNSYPGLGARPVVVVPIL